MPSSTACESTSIHQRNYWLLQFDQLKIAPVVQTCSQGLMWYGNLNYVSSPYEYAARKATFIETSRLFPQARRVASPVWDPSVA